MGGGVIIIGRVSPLFGLAYVTMPSTDPLGPPRGAAGTAVPAAASLTWGPSSFWCSQGFLSPTDPLVHLLLYMCVHILFGGPNLFWWVPRVDALMICCGARRTALCGVLSVYTGTRGTPSSRAGRALAATFAPSSGLGVRCAGMGWLQSLGLLLEPVPVLHPLVYVSVVAPVESLPER